ncbi:MAG: DUF3078 domain-containing protein [Bacteroidota bacterium]
MRILVVILIGFVSFQSLHAQELQLSRMRNETSRTIKKDADTSKWNWKRGGLLSMNLAQGSLSNWAAGGDNFSLTVNGYFNYFFFYRKDRHTWDNNIDVNLGYIQSTSFGSRKNDDRFDYLSKYGYKMDTTGRWYLSTLFNFRSQFFDGYTFSNNVGDFSSSFLSPAYVILSVGFDYKPALNLSMFISPLTSRSTIINNNTLAQKGVYGVPAGKHALNEIGAFASVNYNNAIAKNVNYKGRLDLFSNYQTGAQNVDVFMTNLFSFKINKYFSATYSLDMIYDDDIRLFGATNTSPGLQTKSLIGIGFLKPLNVKKTKYS